MKALRTKYLILVLLALSAFSKGVIALPDENPAISKDYSCIKEVSCFNTSNILFGDDTVSYSQIDIDQIADSLTQKVINDNKIVDLLDPKKVYTLPIGIGKRIGGVYYIVVLDDLRFTTTGLTAKAYMSLSFPGSSKKIGLVADDVKISIDGIQAAKLKMLKDKPLDLSGNNSLLIDADSTFIEWDCNGYKDIKLAAKLLLDPSTFYKENPSTRSIITGELVSGKISCTVTDLNDILFSISLDPFQVKNLKDFSFYPKEIVLDMSDTRNAESMQFPSGYESALFDGADKKLWRGLFIRSFTLKFPKKFAKNGPSPEVTAENFLVDMEGVTGSVKLDYPLLTLEQGNLGGWNFSINSVSLSLDKNELSGFGMSGGILLPITEKNKPLNYKALIDSDKNFLFQVTLPGSINAPLFGSGSKLTINSNSSITVVSMDGEFYPKAILNGKMDIKIPGSSGASLADITFQGLTIQREEPLIDFEALSMQSGMMSGFPVQITEIKVQRDEAKKDFGLQFTADANLMNGKIDGETSFVVWATRSDGDWHFKELELRRIAVDANIGAISLAGRLENFKDDPVYGNGYYGAVKMSVTPGIAVSAISQFGNVMGERYWYADASLKIPSGITVFSGFAIYGFGGGAYYHMQRNAPVNVLMETKSDTSKVPKPGKTDSGITFTPNKNIALGFSAKVIIGTQPSADAFNGSVTFGMEFSSSFGLNKLYFLGEGRFMTDVNKIESDAKVKAKVSIEYLFAQKELSGFAEAFINVAGVIKGAGSNNSAGKVEFYFAKSKWHIYIGTPTSPVAVKLLNSVSATSYFMVGTELPDFPQLPASLQSLASNIDFSKMRNPSLTKTGGGFAFGASLLVSTGQKNFLIFYGKFELGAGFDFMLKNFGDDVKCAGRSGEVGINGWYAMGQAWAYVEASIGVRVRVFGVTKRFSIIDAEFAAVLGAQLPNPTFLAGAVEARFSVLGGAVSGKCHFEFSYGDKCVLENASAVEGIKVIAEVTPSEGEKDVDVFLTPQAAFNIPVDKEFKILDTDNKTKSFRIALDYFKILDNGKEISSIFEWNASKDVLALKPSEVLPGKKGLTASIKVHFQYMEAGVWKDYIVGGKVEGEEYNVLFTTGEAPDYITESNVKYTYPVKNMVNFYKKEFGKCYIQVNQGVGYLFDKAGSWTYLARFTSGETTLNMPITYSVENKRVELSVPASLANNAVYQMRIIRVPGDPTRFVVDQNVVSKNTAIGEEQSVNEKEINGTLSDEGLTVLYSLYFRSSSFNTFVDKMNSLSATYSRYSVTNFIKQLHINFKGSEPSYELFDTWEMQNIKILALVDQTSWYSDNYKDLIYYSYPLVKGMEITYRETSTIGVPPVWVSELMQYSVIPSLTNDAITQGQVFFDPQSSTRLEYNLCYYVTNDWSEIRNLTFYLDPNNRNSKLNLIKNSSYTGIYSSSSYPVKFFYHVPGQTAPTSEYIKTIYY